MSDIDDCLKSVERLTRDREEVMRAGNDKIAEIERLRAEVERLHQAHQAACEGGDLLPPSGRPSND